MLSLLSHDLRIQLDITWHTTWYQDIEKLILKNMMYINNANATYLWLCRKLDISVCFMLAHLKLPYIQYSLNEIENEEKKSVRSVPPKSDCE